VNDKKERRKSRIKKEEKKKVCYGNNESPYVLLATIKEKTEITTRKDISIVEVQ